MALIYSYFQKDDIGRVRKAQEDSHGLATNTPNGTIFIVCDGMGGHVGGKQASSIAVKCILEHFQAQQYSNIPQALNDALQYANMQIIGYAATHPELKGMGTTACIVVIAGDNVYIAHVGDSRIYLFLEKEKQLHRITKDHSFVQTLVDAGEISDDEAENHPNKNRILKALGVKERLQPTICANPIIAKKGDTFLICSDGLSGMLHDTVIERILMTDEVIEQKGTQLIQTALNNGGLDNVTVTLVQITDSPHNQSAFTSFNPSNRIYPNPISPEVSGAPVVSGNSNRSKSWIAILAAAVTTTLILLLGGGGIAYHWWQGGPEMRKLNSELDIVNDSITLLEAEYKNIFRELTENDSILNDVRQRLNKLGNTPTDDPAYMTLEETKEKCIEYSDSLNSEKDVNAKKKAELETRRDTLESKLSKLSKLTKLDKDESTDNR